MRVGCANQTTMLMSESLAIGEMFREAMTERYGDAELAAHFRAFDTICSATQERQDAVIALLDARRARPDARGRGLQQQQHRATWRKSAPTRVPDVPHRRAGVPASPSREIRYRPSAMPSTVALRSEEVQLDWLPPTGQLTVGLTAGASTPNNIVGQAIERLEQFGA